jgi:hypothetical protein
MINDCPGYVQYAWNICLHAEIFLKQYDQYSVLEYSVTQKKDKQKQTTE